MDTIQHTRAVDMTNAEDSLNRNCIYTNGDAVVERLDTGTILIAGGGPVGLLRATVLAHYGLKSTILERNETTTKSVCLYTIRDSLAHAQMAEKWISPTSDWSNF